MKRTVGAAALAAILWAEAVLGQLSGADIAALQSQGQQEGWTFKIAPNPATQRPLGELCGLVVPKDWRKAASFTLLAPTSGLPDSFDWRALGGCTPIRNQRTCGSCWAFATVAPFECAIKIKDGVEVDLSEQWLIDCNRQGYNCNGGWFVHDYHQWKTDSCGGTGAVLEATLPYNDSASSCGCPYSHPYRLDSWSYVGSSAEIPSPDAIKQAIMKYGPVSVAIYASSAFQAYAGGVFNACAVGTLNHAVVLVGWDDHQGANGVWFLRNSWGTGWGEGGYGRIEYGCLSVGYATCYVDYAGSDPLQVAPAESFTSSGPAGGPFAPACMGYTLTNSSSTALAWTAARTQSWLDIVPAAGQLAPKASAPVSVCVNTAASSLPTGNYTDTVAFTNMTTGKGRARPVTLRIGQMDYFTEIFEANDNDLANQTVRFTPTGSVGSYKACREPAAAFPTNPAGGTRLSLTDDSFAAVVLSGGATVLLYGQRYSSFYVGSNGYVTFTEGDSGFFKTLEQHFRLPRISALLNDLNPEAGGDVSWKQLADRVAVTWRNVPEWDTSNTNSFQIEMFFDGRIAITWLALAATGGVAGLSAGAGVPADFAESNLSGYGSCFVAADCDRDGNVDIDDFSVFQGCFNGPNRSYPTGCTSLDLDHDSDVDLADFSIFQACFNGPNRPPACQ
jgi:hypothetical protein